MCLGSVSEMFDLFDGRSSMGEDSVRMVRIQ